MLLPLLVYGLLVPLAAPDAPPEGERCWSGSRWDWCTPPPTALPDAADAPPTMTTTTPATAAPAPPSTFTVVPLGGNGAAPALLVAVREGLAASWRGADAVIEVSAVAASSCVDVVCGRRENAVDVVIAADVAASPDGSVVTVFVDDGGRSVSAVREVDVAGDVVAAAIEALAEARAKLAPTTDPTKDSTTTPTTTPELTTTTTKPPQATAAPDDLLMLGVAYMMMLLPVGGLFLPLWQTLAFVYGGPELVKVEYPNAWQGAVAGVVVDLVGVAAFAAFFGGGLYAAAQPDGNPVAALAAFGAGFTALTLSTFAEPAVFYFFARDGAVPIDDGAKKPKPPAPTTTP